MTYSATGNKAHPIMHRNPLKAFRRSLRLLNHPLNEHRKLHALRRWLGWKIGAGLVPGPVIFSFVNNAVLTVEPGLNAATCNLYTGIYEFADMSFVLHMLRGEDLFVDVGANIGSYTVLATAVRGAYGIAIEPVPSAFAHLLRNLNLNGIRSMVRAFNVAVGSTHGTVRLTTERDAVNHVVTKAEMDERDVIEVDVKTLDEIVGTAEPTLIKVDVEGYETQVVDGARKTLSRDSLLAVIMELNGSGARYGYSEDAVHERMLDYGFAPCTYSPFERSLQPLAGRNVGEDNTLYVRRSDIVLERLRSAPPFQVAGVEI